MKTFFRHVFLYAGILLCTSVYWLFTTWRNLSPHELFFEITAPLQGTGGDMIAGFIRKSFLPSVVIFFLFSIFFHFSDKRKTKIINVLWIVTPVCLILGSLLFFVHKLDLVSYVRNRNSNDTFVEEHYVAPDSVSVTFPEKKRNLIYICMESMEITLADKANGGVFPENIIPELTACALEHEDFSGEQDLLNGAYSLTGSTWTMGGIFAQASGLPLIDIPSVHEFERNTDFFPDIITLGDILSDQGYQLTHIQGADIAFAGHDAFYSTHGSFHIIDYNEAIESGMLKKEDSAIWAWGFEDAKLYEYAKEELAILAENEEPFCLSLLTVDTHFSDGHICPLCQNEFDSQYANVYACASKQVTEFVNWIREQDFFENTTIVIAGDHPTMENTFVDPYLDGYDRRVATIIINGANTVNKPQNRIYSTMDLFPTTLAALGVSVEGDRLGLGVNLYSDEQTLLEQYSVEEVNRHIERGYRFLASLSGQAQAVLAESSVLSGITVIQEKDSFKVVCGIPKIPDDGLRGVYFEIINESSGGTFHFDAVQLTDGGMWVADVTEAVSEGDYGKIDAYYYDNSGNIHAFAFLDGCMSMMRHDDLAAYCNIIKQDRERYIVLIAAGGEFCYHLSPQKTAVLHDLGFISIDTCGLDENAGYCGIADNLQCWETTNKDTQETKIQLKYDELDISVEGGGINSITLNNVEESLQKRGINIVVYDRVNECIADRAAFGTTPLIDESALKRQEREYSKIVFDREISGVLQVKEEENYYKIYATGIISPYFPARHLAFQTENEGDGSQFDAIQTVTTDVYNQQVVVYECRIPKDFVLPDNVIQMVALDDPAYTVPVADFRISDLQMDSVNDYLSQIAGQTTRTVLMSFVDNGQDGAVPPELFDMLDPFGIERHGDEEYRTAWCAVITDDEVTEFHGEHEYDETGMLEGDVPYQFINADWFNGHTCEIHVGGGDYAVGTRGLNVVVYDHNLKKVTDAFCIDIYDDMRVSRRLFH